VMQETRDG